MGFFRRKETERPEPTPGARSFGHAAFDPADVEDARRGHPATTLEPFAQTRGWPHVGSQLVGRFVGTQPRWREYVFNACHGPLPSGRLGMLAHELLEVEAHHGSVEAGGGFYDVRVTTRTSAKAMAGLRTDEAPNEPFAGNAVWIPTTTAYACAQETVRLPRIQIGRTRAISFFGNRALDGLGLPGFRARRGDDAAMGAVVPAIGPWLATRGDPYLDLRVEYGNVALTVNGYRTDPTDLEHLTSIVDGVAAALATLLPAIEAPWEALGPAWSTDVRPAPGVPLPSPYLVPRYLELADRWGLHHEDPAHVSGLLPRCPIPGVPSGVLAGRLAEGGPLVRLVWTAQGDGTGAAVRPGVIVPARPGASTPTGGHLDPERGMYAEVVDGLACCWRQGRTVNSLDADELVRDARTSLAAAGLADL